MWFPFQYGIISIQMYQIWCFYHILTHLTQFGALFIIICRRGGGGASPLRTMDPDLFLLNKMLKASINSFVDIFLNIYYIIVLIIE